MKAIAWRPLERARRLERSGARGRPGRRPRPISLPRRMASRRQLGHRHGRPPDQLAADRLGAGERRAAAGCRHARAWKASSAASPATVTALATSRPPGAQTAASSGRAGPVRPHAAADEDGVGLPAGRPSAVRRLAHAHDSSSGTPSCAALAPMRAARSASRSIAIARMPRPARSHSMATLPAPAPTSHSSSPSQRCQGREGHGADLGLGELAVMVEGVVGQARDAGSELAAPGSADELDRHRLRSAKRLAAQVRRRVRSTSALVRRRPAPRAPRSGWRRSRLREAARRSRPAPRRRRSAPAGAGRAGGAGAARSSGRPCGVSACTSSSGQPRRLQPPGRPRRAAGS